MVELPKVVRQRLEVRPDPGPHPDANQLSALLEKNLGERERIQLLSHISACADCREIVSLALPEFQPAGTASADRARPPWLSWPVLRWAAAAACVVVVGAAVSLRYQESRKALAPAQRVRQDKIAANTMAVPAPPAPKKTEIATASKPKSPEERLDLLKRRQSAPAIAGPAAIAKERKSAEPPAEQAEAFDNKVANQSVESAQAVAATPGPEAMPGKAKDALQQESGARVSPAAPAAGVVGGVIMSGKAPAPLADFSLTNLVPRWTLSADGTLQRSLDGGKSWQTIHVADKVVFRALTANRAEIWVGGTHGSLYHSTDAGQHWTQVQPGADGKALTADIIGVEFTDSHHGKVTAAGEQVWTTSDGGQTWRQQ